MDDVLIVRSKPRSKVSMRIRSITLTPGLGIEEAAAASKKHILFDPEVFSSNQFEVGAISDFLGKITIPNEVNLVFQELQLPKECQEKLMMINFCVYPNPNEFIISEDGKFAFSSFSQLILHLTSPNFCNPSLQRVLLLTMISYIHPILFFSALIVRYYSFVGFSQSNVSDNTQMKLIRHRIVSIIGLWSKLCNYHFTNKLLGGLSLFSDLLTKANSLEETNQKIVRSSVNHIKKQITQMIRPIALKSECVGPNTMLKQFLDSPTEALAKQITLRNSYLFRSIMQHEWIQSIFTEEKRGSLKDLITYFDQLTRFVSFSVVFGTNERERADIYTMWAKVSIHLRQSNDFMGLFSVISGLTHKSVSRLIKTIRLSLKYLGKQKSTFESLFVICEMDNDFKNYREVISSSPSPSIPFIACFQKDWVYFRETYCPPPLGLISIKHLESAVEMLDRVSWYQNDEYSFSTDENIQSLLRGLPDPPSSKSLMAISLLREPN